MKSGILRALVAFLEKTGSTKIRCRIFAENPNMRGDFCTECRNLDECSNKDANHEGNSDKGGRRR